MKKIYSCSIVSKILAVGIAACMWVIGSVSASAAEFIFDLENIGAVEIDVQVSVLELGDGTLRFTVSQDNPDAFGDLTAILFHVNDSIIDPTDLDFTFVSAVENITGDPLITTISESFNVANYNGFKNYDVLVEFGTDGIGTDDINTITFDVATTVIGGSLDLLTFMPVNMEEFLAVRANSAWDGNDREGSSKLVCCGTTVPEPDTMGLLAFAFGGLLWRRRVLSAS